MFLWFTEVRVVTKFDWFCVSCYYCCDQKAPAASAQSFPLWQQATIDIMHRIIACSCHIYYTWVLFSAHIPFVVNHTFTQRQRRCCSNMLSFSQRTAPITRFFLLRLPHPGHFTILSRWENPSGKCAKLHLWQQVTTEIMRRNNSSRDASC